MERAGLDALFQKYYERLVLFAESYVSDITIAEDMVQDVFLNLLSRSDLEPIEFDRSYVYSCVKNSCVDYLRKLKVTDPLDVKLFDAVYYIGDFDFGEDKLIERVKVEIEKLPVQRREVLKLSVYKKLSYGQIAEKTGLSVNTVKTHMKKAYQELRDSLYIDHQQLCLLIILSYLKSECIGE